jgi:hypothetical protein
MAKKKPSHPEHDREKLEHALEQIRQALSEIEKTTVEGLPGDPSPFEQVGFTKHEVKALQKRVLRALKKLEFWQ